MRRLRVSATPRLVRAYSGARQVLETERATIVYEPGKAVGFYAVPRSDVTTGILLDSGERPGRDHPGAQRYLDLATDGGTRARAAWTYDLAGLTGYVGLGWDAFDRWFEEAEEVFIHPRSPYSRVDALRSSRHVVVRDGERTLAETNHPIAVFENRIPVRWYIPAADVRQELFVDVDLRTGCPYKGFASYRALADNPERVVQWYYESPEPEVAAIKDHVAFFNELVDVIVDKKSGDRPLTQWSYGLRDNSRGGGSGTHQEINSSGDHPREHDEEAADVVVEDAFDAVVRARSSSAAAPGVTWERTERWIRGTLAGTTIVDSRNAVMMWDADATPTYAVPAEDVRTDLLRSSSDGDIYSPNSGPVEFDLVLGDRVSPAAVRRCNVPELAGYVAFPSSPGKGGLDHWYEEAEEILGQPRDPYHRVDALPSSRRVRVLVDGICIGDTRRAVVVFETGCPVRHYIPWDDVAAALEPSGRSSYSPYLGLASYWNYPGNGRPIIDAAWTIDGAGIASRLENMVAFDASLVEIVVDEHKQRPEAADD